MDKKIRMVDGAGGKQMDYFIKEKILKHFKKNVKAEVGLFMLDDAAVIDDIVFSTDSHTVKPVIFPGGDIGSLAVSGTVNDVSVMGAKPVALSTGFIIEEGFSADKFEQIVKSMAEYAEMAKVEIVTGDTKVVEKNAVQEFMINTTGIGVRPSILDENIHEINRYRKQRLRWLVDSNLRPGDKIIISGNIGEHGVALMSFREGYGFETQVKSDVAPINTVIDTALKIGGVVTAKDPTRGGLANTLNEISEKSKTGIIIKEENIPIPEGVRSACGILGIDPLSIGNEGKVVLGVIKEKADEVLTAIRKNPLGKNARIIGEATNKYEGVVLETAVGGIRNLYKPLGDPIPRIC